MFYCIFLRLGPKINPPGECISSTPRRRTNSRVTLLTSSFIIIIADIRQTKFGPEMFMNVQLLKEVGIIYTRVSFDV